MSEAGKDFDTLPIYFHLTKLVEAVHLIDVREINHIGGYYRTARLNEAVRQIYLIEKELQENKNGTSEENFDLCRKAGLRYNFRTAF
jgi:hypothetical protein